MTPQQSIAPGISLGLSCGFLHLALRHRSWKSLLLAGLCGMVCVGLLVGCVTVQRVQVGPENWDCFLRPRESNAGPSSKPAADGDLPNPLLSPASQPDAQTPKEILDESIDVFLERYR